MKKSLRRIALFLAAAMLVTEPLMMTEALAAEPVQDGEETVLSAEYTEEASLDEDAFEAGDPDDDLYTDEFEPDLTEDEISDAEDVSVIPEEPQGEDETPDEPEDGDTPDPADQENDENAEILPDVTEDPEEEDLSFEALDSESIDARTLNENTAIKITSVAQNPDTTLVTIKGDCPRVPGTGEGQRGEAYLIAETDTTRYYLARSEITADDKVEFNSLSINLPGRTDYSLRIAQVPAKSSQKELTASAVYWKKVHVPEASSFEKIVPQNSESAGRVYLATPSDYMPSGGIILMNEKNVPVTNVWKTDEGGEEYLELSAGIYKIRRVGNTLSSSQINVAAQIVTFEVPYETRLTFIDSYFYVNGTTNAFVTVRSKGAVRRIHTDFTDVGFPDKRLKYESQNTKVATVDSQGNVKAVGAGTAKIVVTSLADPSHISSVFMIVDPYDLKKFAFDEPTIAGEVNPKQTAFTKNFTLSFDEGLKNTDTPITFNVSGDGGMTIRPISSGNPPYVMTYTVEHLFGNSVGFQLKATEAGVYTVTATSEMGKTAVLTVTVDGYTDPLVASGVYYQRPTASSVFYRKGKKVTGWIGFDSDANKWLTGKDVLKGKVDEYQRRDVHYLDPKTGHPVTPGIRKIDKKLYAFHGYVNDPAEEQGELLYHSDNPEGEYHIMEGNEIVYDPSSDTYPTVRFKADATVATGWTVLGTYQDPMTGYPIRYGWVPYKTGYTWVNDSGLRRDDNGKTLDIVMGHFPIMGDPYLFFDGVAYTGWKEYLSEEGIDIGKSYYDPADHGRLRLGTFSVKGKEYRTDASGLVVYPDCFDSEAKYIYVNESGEDWISDSKGAVVKNKMVKAANFTVSSSDPDYGKLHTMYADKDGNVVKDQAFIIKKKQYLFDENGFASEKGSNPTVFYVKSNGELKNVERKTDAKGVVSYAVGGRKLTNAVLYTSGGNPRLAVDKSGKLALNKLIPVRKDIAKKQTTYYLTNDEGYFINPEDYDPEEPATLTNGEIIYYDTSRNNALYAISRDKEVAVGKLAVVGFETKDGNVVAKHYAYAGKDGKLAREKIIKIKGVGRVMFSYSGEDVSYGGVYSLLGKSYWVTPSAEANYKGYAFSVIRTQKKAHYEWLSGTPYLVNKDGSIKNGWITHPEDSSKRYFRVIDGEDCEYLYAESSYDGARQLYRIGGKLYLFGGSDTYLGSPITGWVMIKGGRILEINKKFTLTGNEETFTDDKIFYFDPKTGAAVTGWCKVPAPDYMNGEFITDSQSLYAYKAYRVNSGTEKKKLYFDPDGDLVRGAERTLKGKLYAFEEDGSPVDEKGWADSKESRYVNNKGQILTGLQTIDGNRYYFDSADGEKARCQLRKTGGKWYYFDDQGAVATPAMGTKGKAYYPGAPLHDTVFASATGKDLTANWNKDGSLKSIVYTDTGKPAARESILFGIWTEDAGEQLNYLQYGMNGYVLDGKGLPMTGVTPDFTLGDGITYSMLRASDGASIIRRTDIGLSLVKSGKKYYLMDQGFVYTGHAGTVKYVDKIYSLLPEERPSALTDWSSLPAKEREIMDFYANLVEMKDVPLYLIIGDDGSVISNQKVYATLGTKGGLWHTGALGIPMDHYYVFYKFNGKWYGQKTFDDYDYRVMELGKTEENRKKAEVRLKDDGTLIGIYDLTTGKALTGSFITYLDEYITLKKGKPVTGKLKFRDRAYKLISEIGIYMRYGI